MVTTFLLLFFLLIGVLFLRSMYRRYRKNKTCPIPEEDFSAYFAERDLQHEEKVRKQWLHSFFVILILSFLSCLLPWFISSEELQNILSESEKEGTGLFASITSMSLLLYIPYHCAYRKRGTIWLLLSIIVTPIRELIDIRDQLLSHPSLSIFDWTTLFFAEGIAIWFWVNCIRLRRVNAFRKSQINRLRGNNHFQKETVPIA